MHLINGRHFYFYIMENIEVWKPIKDYEGLYEVSSLGRIRSLDKVVRSGIKNSVFRTIKGRILKPREDKYGYACITLSKNLKTKNYFIHRLVAISFIPNPENKKQVNHKNGVKCCNVLSNLEWNTLSENRQHAYDSGLQKAPNGEGHYKSIFSKEDVLDIRRIGRTKTLTEIAKIYNVDFRNISNILLYKTYKNYKHD